MKVISSVVLSCLTLLFAASCGDDSESGDGGDPTQCRGVYGAWTSDDLDAATTSGACEGHADAVCARDLNTDAGACGQSCYGMHMDDPAGLAACSLECLKQGSPNPSDACLTCYLGSVQCVQMNCLTECLGDPSSAACNTCRGESGCTAAFYACSGLPDPADTP